jgi:hypothetical protein
LVFQRRTFLEVRLSLEALFSLNDVRFTLESGNVRCTSVCPLRAKSGHPAMRIMQIVANEKPERNFSLKGTQVASGSIPLIDLELTRASDLREAADKTSVMHLIDQNLS